MSLATIDDCRRFKVQVDGREAEAEALLEVASSSITAAAGSPIMRGTHTVVLPGVDRKRLPLPFRPVVHVESVLIDGTLDTSWKLIGDSLYRDNDWASPNEPTSVQVTFTAGFTNIPEDIKRLCCSMVAAGLAQSENGGLQTHTGIAYERIDDYQIGYTQGENALIDAMQLPEATCKMLRSRFGSPGLAVRII